MMKIFIKFKVNTVIGTNLPANAALMTATQRDLTTVSGSFMNAGASREKHNEGGGTAHCRQLLQRMKYD